jgi:hypothetical protein
MLIAMLQSLQALFRHFGFIMVVENHMIDVQTLSLIGTD